MPNKEKELANIFWEHKCGLEGTEERFFKWCSEIKNSTSVEAKCNNITGIPGPSNFKGLFQEQQPNQIILKVDIQNEKGNKLSTTYTLESDLKTRISKYCDQQLGASDLPIWAVVLFALLVLAVLASAAFFSWKYCSSNSPSGSSARSRKRPSLRASTGTRMSPKNSRRLSRWTERSNPTVGATSHSTLFLRTGWTRRAYGQNQHRSLKSRKLKTLYYREQCCGYYADNFFRLNTYKK